MRFELKIDCDNAAFESDAFDQVAWILTRIAQYISSAASVGGVVTPVYDENGNKVGHYMMLED